MDCVTVLGPLWLLFYGFFKVKLFNLEKVQGRKIRRLALTLVEKVAAQFSLKKSKKKKKRQNNVWLKTKVRKVQKTEPWWMYILKKCTLLVRLCNTSLVLGRAGGLRRL